MTTTDGAGTAAAPRTTRWRPVDIVVASVLGVAGGLLFVLWNIAGAPLRDALGFYPPLAALTYGLWLLPGVLVGLVVRKPGAALYGEVVAAVVSMLVGNAWGFLTLVSGLLQGLGAEAAFAATRYRRSSVGVAVLSGAGAGLVAGVYEVLYYYGGVLAPTTQVLYVVAFVLSGAVLAGVGSWLLARALRRTGALAPLASGRGGERV